MNISILFLLLLLAVESASATQRLSAIQPGSSCAGIAQIETSLGSDKLADVDPAGVIRYAGKQDGRDATISYGCDKGVLTEQIIVVTATSEDQAYAVANALKSRLIARLGEPLHDGLDLGIWSRLNLGFKGADLDYLTMVVVWGRATQDVMLSIRQTGEDLWEISISQGRSKIEYILNS